VAITEVILLAWMYGVDNIFDHIQQMEIHIPMFMKIYWKVCWKYLTPGILCVLLTGMTKNFIFLIALLCVGTILIIMDIFPNQFGKLNDKRFGRCLIKMIKGMSLLLIFASFWIRLYQNISDVKIISRSDDLTEDEKYHQIVANVYEVVINIVLVSILPAVALWTAIKKDLSLMMPQENFLMKAEGNSNMNRHAHNLIDQESHPFV